MMFETTCQDWRLILRREFAGDDEGFITRLQQDLIWDRVAFQELVLSMREACLLCAEDEELERWVAHGFFYLPAFVRAWTQQDDFPRPELEYWRRALTALEELSHWFFWGEPMGDNEDIDPAWLDEND